MLIVHHLAKRFGDYWALRGVGVDLAARGSGLFARPGEHDGVIPRSPSRSLRVNSATRNLLLAPRAADHPI